MSNEISAENLHRTAKYFMDSGRADTYAAALTMLEGFSLAVHVGADIETSRAKQVAVLTLVNLAHRTLLGGVTVVGVPDCQSLTALAQASKLRDAVAELGGRCSDTSPGNLPVAVIGNALSVPTGVPAWRMTWEGWRGGVAPLQHGVSLADDENFALAPMVAAACCVGEVFSYLADDHPMAGHRATGLSLWRPEASWHDVDLDEPVIEFLPSRLWLIGLGNLGQAFCWALAALPYANPYEVELMLQDFDTLADSNVSTSLLTFPATVGQKKTRMAAAWLETRGFKVVIEERRFGAWTGRDASEPGVAFCGVDNALARSALEDALFDLVVEAGLGAGPDGFRGLSLHTFPASRSARSIWSGVNVPASGDLHLPAYATMAADGMDECGLATLASRTVGVPFVGLLAAVLAVSELLRRLHGGSAYELLATASDSLDDVATIIMPAPVYSHGHVSALPMAPAR
ncbi:ubiquitin-activating E1 family protein [Fuscibacter oryzae]|uniref:Thiamine biosynthesis protein ThiF n=1 Tax=Fuscibacter oryzae TaxID=2803939 RepID=A0A8J7MQR6_9RHOB|nr:hypothetical protein [Fuscibacter oryzae]MBL4929505.1 hypothetical protein [Fuscibacter oryzae]